MRSGSSVGSGELLLGGLGCLWVQGESLHWGGHLPAPDWSWVSHLYVEKVEDLKPPTGI